VLPILSVNFPSDSTYSTGTNRLSKFLNKQQNSCRSRAVQPYKSWKDRTFDSKFVNHTTSQESVNPYLGGLEGDAALEEDAGDVGEDSPKSAQRCHPEALQFQERAPRAPLCRQEPRNVSSTRFRARATEHRKLQRRSPHRKAGSRIRPRRCGCRGRRWRRSPPR
jgi:hypothetical protein